jgi:transposase
MRTDYPRVISEDEPMVRRRARRGRGRPTVVRVQALRLLNRGTARSLADCAHLVGHSPRQVARRWATSQRKGLEALREPHFPGRPSRLTPSALGDLERVMAAGQIAALKDAQTYLADHHGIVYPSLNGVWAQLRKHRMQLKTGCRHALADAAAPEAFQAGFRHDAGARQRAERLGR